MKVSDLMSNQVICIHPGEPVTAAARLLKTSNVGALPVCDGERRLRGIVTDRDIVLRCVATGADPAHVTVGEIMSRGVLTTGPLEDVEQAAQQMSREQVRRLPVLSSGRLVGFLSLCDLARDGNCDMEAASALSDISAGSRRS